MVAPRYIPDPEGRIRRRRLIAAAICLLLVAVGTFVYFIQKSWRVERLTKEARASIVRGDYAEASLQARRALQVIPDHPPACTLMAEICERAHDSDAVAWREKAVELSAGSTESLIACASTAVNFGRMAAAERALKRVPEADRNRGDFHALSGSVALDAGKFAEAERLFSEAARLEPDKLAHRFSLGRAQVSSRDYLTRETGRRVLAELAGRAEFTVPALRVLIASHEFTGEPQAALGLSEKLIATPAHAFPDEIVRLRLLRATHDSGFALALAMTQEKAAGEVKNAGALLVWMSSVGLAGEALDWALKRTSAVGRLPGIEAGVASCHLALGDWAALFSISQKGRWDAEYIRRAYRARALREQHNATPARTEWDLALSSARTKPDGLTWLARTAIEWKWRDEAEQVLWESLEKVPGATQPVELLKGHYIANENTAGLMRIAGHLLKVNAANEDAQNDLALLSLLLGKDHGQALTVTRTLHEKHSGSAAYASTYAFALHCANRPDEALRLFDSMPEDQLREPAYAAYYGIVLAATNSLEKARHFLEIAQHASLLPEERELVEKASRASAPDDGAKEPGATGEIKLEFARPTIPSSN